MSTVPFGGVDCTVTLVTKNAFHSTASGCIAFMAQAPIQVTSQLPFRLLGIESPSPPITYTHTYLKFPSSVEF